MRRRELLNYAGLLTLGPVLKAASGAKPNVIILWASGWRGQALPGIDPNLQAPVMERFASQASVFHRHYCGRLLAPTPDDPWKAAGYEISQDPRFDLDYLNNFLKHRWRTPFFLSIRLVAPPIGGRTRNPDRVILRPNVPESLQSEARRSLASYYDSLESLDVQIGRILTMLDESTAASNTIVVFTSDHGQMLGSQGIQGWDVAFEESLRVPLMIRHPGKSAAGPSDVLTSNADIQPTLLTLCGVPVPANTQGQDVSSNQRLESIYAVGQLGTPAEWRAIVRGLDKIVFDRELNVTHLYNLGQDPFEMENLAQDRSQELKRNELAAILKVWMRRASDGMDPSGLKRRK
jgi:arylsulfatase A-like enzyme